MNRFYFARHAVGLAICLSILAGCQSADKGAGWRWPWGSNASSPRVSETPAHIGPLEPEQKADIQFALAIAAERQGRTDEARKMYQQVAHVLPDQPEVYHRMALLYSRQGDCRKAEASYHHALQLDPQNAALLCDLGYNHYLQQQWSEAERYLRQAIALDPELARAHNNLGLVLSRTGREQEALLSFARAGASRAEASANLAFALSLENRLDEARNEFQRALEFDPQLQTAHDGLARLDQLVTPRDSHLPAAPHTLPAPP